MPATWKLSAKFCWLIAAGCAMLGIHDDVSSPEWQTVLWTAAFLFAIAGGILWVVDD